MYSEKAGESDMVVTIRMTNVPKDDDPITCRPVAGYKGQLKALRWLWWAVGCRAGRRAAAQPAWGRSDGVRTARSQWGGRVSSNDTFADGRIIEKAPN